MGENWRAKRCHDCGCGHDEIHELGCDMERCPYCLGQLISCDCAYELLGLVDHDEYPDTGGLPPKIYRGGLSSEQGEKWLQLINVRGRIPYQSPGQPGIADNVWSEFVHPDGHCSLCGNSGVIDTRGHVETAAGWKVGARCFCICPNGRAWKTSTGNPSQ